MGAMQNNAPGEKAGKKQRGSVNNKRRLDAFARARGGAKADWAECDAHKLLGVVERITRLGGAVTIGLSRDMGAHSLTLLLDGERETLWFNGDADLDQELTNVMGMLDAVS